MKIAILNVLLAALVAVTLADRKSELEAFDAACLLETKTLAKESHDFWETNVDYAKTTPNMKCHLKCVMEKMGHLKGGVFDADKTAKDWKEFDEHSFKPKAFSACKNEKGPNDCETAFKITKCLQQFKE